MYVLLFPMHIIKIKVHYAGNCLWCSYACVTSNQAATTYNEPIKQLRAE